MAHFARLDSNNNVVHIHVVDNENLLDENGVEQEAIGINYLASVHGGLHNWVQCSYNGSFRARYPGIGYTYDTVNNVFLTPKQYPSWVLDSNYDWQAPVAIPSYDTDTQYAFWNEDNQVWDILDRTL